MHSYLWSGKDSSGKKRADRVEAQSREEAKAILEKEGWTELELVGTEIHDAIAKSRHATSQLEQPEPTPDQEAASLQGKKTGLAAQWWKTLWQSGGYLGLIVILLVLGIVRHHTITIAIACVTLAFMVFVYPVLHFYYTQTSRNYARLNRAKVEGNWNEVLACVEKIRRSGRLTKIGASDVELARNRAIALAHLGQLDQALTEFNSTPGLSSVPAWLANSLLCNIYDIGRQYDKVLELRRQIVAEKPEMAAGWVDLASTLVRRLNRPAEAREALSRVANMPLTALERPFINFVTGIILWRENHPAEAKAQFELALNGFVPMAAKPLVPGVILLVKSYLAVVNGELGNVAEARRLYAEVRRFLETHQEDELLQACRRFV